MSICLSKESIVTSLHLVCKQKPFFKQKFENMAFLFVLLFVVPSLGMHSTLLHHLTVKPCASPIPPSLPSLKQIAHSTRQRLVDVFQATPNATAGLMLLFAGSLDHREDTDTEVAFRQESNFLYATQIALPDYIVTMNTKYSNNKQTIRSF